MDPQFDVTSVLGVATSSARLAGALYDVSSTLKAAKKDVQLVAGDFRTFAAILRTVHRSLANANRRAQHSAVVIGAGEVVRGLVDGIKSMYEDAYELLASLESMKNDGSLALRIRARFAKARWLFQKSRIEVLSGRLKSFQASLHLLVSTVDLEVALEDKFPPDLVEALKAEKDINFKLAELQNRDLTATLKEAEGMQTEARKLISRSSLLLGLPALRAWPLLDSKPQKAVLQLALIRSGTAAHCDQRPRPSATSVLPPVRDQAAVRNRASTAGHGVASDHAPEDLVDGRSRAAGRGDGRLYFDWDEDGPEISQHVLTAPPYS
ncbi:uncharacterized protein PV09_00079 [Verruconis gallopava]|uniref:Fungal N-terminal domain-containing protein n=1 Tax=Verruconis gallopava TaxID=253628 RepID=A0A0D2AR16_9PEZI|nr:uncharacterized protein PV09_00079 [Verruconis gallopava]KIW09143.1 hypothetical protein PV09_00079 [Verruconis gallopava]